MRANPIEAKVESYALSRDINGSAVREYQDLHGVNILFTTVRNARVMRRSPKEATDDSARSAVLPHRRAGRVTLTSRRSSSHSSRASR